MDFLILGDGEEERAWARAVARDPVNRLVAAYPGFAEFAHLKTPADLDDALALAEADALAVVVGGPIATRAESLRRVAAAGLRAICLHPPGDDSEAYYQVALSRVETGAIVIPDLPLRLHPALGELKRVLEEGTLGGFRGLRLECTAAPGAGDLVRHELPRLIDGLRYLIGEIDAVTATGDPPGPSPTDSLIVHLRGPEARRAEVRIERGGGPLAPPLSRLILTGTAGSLTFEYGPTLDGPTRLVRRDMNGSEQTRELAAWDPHAAILNVLSTAASGSGSDQTAAVHPDLLDGTRAMELSEATVRSLRRGRTVDLHYEQISEAGTFKGVMTSIGCMVILLSLTLLPIALIGPPLGFPATIYLAYAIPPVLILFILFQLLRFAIRSPRGS